MKNGLLNEVNEMTIELYEAILEETKEGNFYKMMSSNKEYVKTYPNERFTLIRRTAPNIGIGFATIIMPTFYESKYFNGIPARMDDICYMNTGTFEEMYDEFRNWLADKKSNA